MIRLAIPMPLQIVIDDVGWWSGADGHERGEPFRSGIGRDHVPADYEAIVALGRALGMRPQAAMVLCEWDRDNILRNLPTSTWMGENWDNSRRVGPWLDEAAGIIRENAEHFELALHGIGHEYWIDGRLSRAEWHDSRGRMRPAGQVRAHLDYFDRILRRNDLGRFPESFVPAAFYHTFGAEETDFAAIARRAGIKYISTPFSTMHEQTPPAHGLFGVDRGVMTVDRGDAGIAWNEVDSRPPEEIHGPILGLHWPNILHENPLRNGETVARWVAALKRWEQSIDRMLAPDTASCWTQLAYRALTRVRQDRNCVRLDIRAVRELGVENLLDWFTVKVEGPGTLNFSATGADIVSREPAEGTDGQILRIRPHPDVKGLELRRRIG